MNGRRAVVLLSGGLDSATVLALARQQGLECYALTIQYGQRHSHEVQCAARIAAVYGAVRHQVINLDLAAFGGSSLLGVGEIPKQLDFRSTEAVAPLREAIPSTYVPARNTVFLALALAWAEVLEAEAIYIGVNAIDYSGYPDCRPEFLEAFSRLSQLATKRGIEGHAIEVRSPLLRMTKGEIVHTAADLGLDFSLTSSCYDPDPEGRPCGECDSCRLRRKGFEEAGMVDPLPADRHSSPEKPE